MHRTFLLLLVFCFFDQIMLELCKNLTAARSCMSFTQFLGGEGRGGPLGRCILDGNNFEPIMIFLFYLVCSLKNLNHVIVSVSA